MVLSLLAIIMILGIGLVIPPSPPPTLEAALEKFRQTPIISNKPFYPTQQPFRRQQDELRHLLLTATQPHRPFILWVDLNEEAQFYRQHKLLQKIKLKGWQSIYTDPNQILIYASKPTAAKILQKQLAKQTEHHSIILGNRNKIHLSSQAVYHYIKDKDRLYAYLLKEEGVGAVPKEKLFIWVDLNESELYKNNEKILNTIKQKKFTILYQDPLELLAIWKPNA